MKKRGIQALQKYDFAEKCLNLNSLRPLYGLKAFSPTKNLAPMLLNLMRYRKLKGAIMLNLNKFCGLSAVVIMSLVGTSVFAQESSDLSAQLKKLNEDTKRLGEDFVSMERQERENQARTNARRITVRYTLPQAVTGLITSCDQTTKISGMISNIGAEGVGSASSVDQYIEFKSNLKAQQRVVKNLIDNDPTSKMIPDLANQVAMGRCAIRALAQTSINLSKLEMPADGSQYTLSVLVNPACGYKKIEFNRIHPKPVNSFRESSLHYNLLKDHPSLKDLIRINGGEYKLSNAATPEFAATYMYFPSKFFGGAREKVDTSKTPNGLMKWVSDKTGDLQVHRFANLADGEFKARALKAQEEFCAGFSKEVLGEALEEIQRKAGYVKTDSSDDDLDKQVEQIIKKN